MKLFITTFFIALLNTYSFSQSANTMKQTPENIISGSGFDAREIGGGDGLTPMNGTGSLGMSYSKTACGLNYVQASVMTATRIGMVHPVGTGFPASLTISGIPNCAIIEQAYVWYIADTNHIDPGFTFNGTSMTSTLIGSGTHKCWNVNDSTRNYRGDVTAAITGNGVYSFSSILGDRVIDGVTLMIIYRDPNATYQGSIQLNDGNMIKNNSSSNVAPVQTMTGLNVCANSTVGNAFLIVSDLQFTTATHTSTLNGSPNTFYNKFWNFDVANTSFVAGQTTADFGIVATLPLDCYDWILMGIYYQTTTCITCSSPNLTTTSTSTDANCGNCNATATVNATGGSSPYSYSWNTSPVQTTQTATGLCAGTYIVTVIDANGCLQANDTVIVDSSNISTPPIITPAGPFCTVDPSIILNASILGGTWSGNGITDASTGLFDPAVAGPGTHVITYTVVGPCGGIQTINIIVSAGAASTINPAGPFCENDPTTTLTSINPGGAWSGNGIVDPVTGAFDPSTAGVGTHPITYLIPGTCGDTGIIAIIVNPNADATITAAGPFCEIDPTVTLTAINPGGVWSGNGITDPVTGTFDPATAGAGTHAITYAIAGPCGDTQTITIIVNSQNGAIITPAGPFCENDPTATLTALNMGGVWSGNGIIDPSLGTFDPSTAGPGTHPITYIIAGSCGDTGTIAIIVIPNADASINPAGPFCINDAPINLISTNPNGTWSGNGITDPATGTFDPGIAGAGTHPITYTIAGACGDAQSITITVTPKDNVSIDPAGPFCLNDNAITLTVTTTGGTWSGNGITSPTTGTFSPSTAGVGTHTITYTISGNCGNSGTITITVGPAPQISFGPTTAGCAPVCVTMTNNSSISAGSISNYTWSFGDGSSTSGATPTHCFKNDSYSSIMEYDVTLTATSNVGCTSTLTNFQMVTVYPIPLAHFEVTPEITDIYSPELQFTDLSIIAATWNWNFGDSTYSTDTNPIHEYTDTGFYMATLYIENIYGCKDTSDKLVSIRPAYAIWIPDAFTPDGDHVNDYFFIDGFGIKEVELNIFDRWGNLLLEDKGTDHTKVVWNGIYKEEIVQQDVYIYKAKVKDVFDKYHNYIGRVSVLK